MSVTPRAKKRTSLNAVGPSVLLRRLLGFLIALDQSSFLVINGGSYFYHVMLCPFTLGARGFSCAVSGFGQV